jgi:rare lipoprotein A (peptidoglycan hydrolase)
MENSQHIGVSTFASCTSPSTVQSLQKSFHLSHADKIELKKISSPSENKKYATARTDTTKTVKLNNDNGLQTRWTETPAGNSRFAKAGVSCFYDSEVLNSSFVYLMKFSAKNPRLRKAAKR